MRYRELPPTFVIVNYRLPFRERELPPTFLDRETPSPSFRDRDVISAFPSNTSALPVSTHNHAESN